MDKITNSLFIDKLISAFPEIKEEVLDDDYINSITLQTGCFKRFTQKAIDGNDRELMLKCFEFVNSYIDIVEFNIENSLAITWLGKLTFDHNNDAFPLLPLKLKSLYLHLQEQYAAPLSDKVKRFLDELDTEE